MRAHLRPALVLVGLFTLFLGLAYPLAVTGIAQAAFPEAANGSLVRDADGRVLGSALIGQRIVGTAYVHPRPSAAGAEGYDASSSSGSNLGPLDQRLRDRVAGLAATLRAEVPDEPIPADAVTASASGLDPDVSPANARRQAARIAAARGVSRAAVEAVLAGVEVPPTFGFVGQPRVNVLAANRALDARFGPPQAGSP